MIMISGGMDEGWTNHLARYYLMTRERYIYGCLVLMLILLCMCVWCIYRELVANMHLILWEGRGSKD
ncbi:hypothetical protein Hanom_Chr16g01511321 [Helianthus anomalus]